MYTIYLAASFADREVVRDLRDLIHDLFPGKVEVTSSWLEESEVPFDDDDEHARWMRGLANEDVEDIRRADAFAVINGTPSTSGGRHTEVGVAIGMSFFDDKDIFIVGPVRENVFQYRAQLVHVPSIPEFMDALEQYADADINTFTRVLQGKELPFQLERRMPWLTAEQVSEPSLPPSQRPTHEVHGERVHISTVITRARPPGFAGFDDPAYIQAEQEAVDSE